MKTWAVIRGVGLTIGVTIVLSACDQEAIVNPQVEETVKDAEATIEKTEGDEILLQSNGELESLGTVKTHDLTLFFAHKTAMVAPEHLVDSRIVYTDMMGEDGQEVYVYDTEKATNQSLYKTSKTIGNLIGIQDELIWIEYEPTEDNAFVWTIYRMKLSETKPTELAEGISAFETPVPYLETSGDRVTWVDYKASETVTTSAVMQYSSKQNLVETLQTYTLQEGERRDGDYVFDFRDSEGGVIVHRSLFVDGDQTAKLTALDGTFDEEMGALIDFEKGEDYVAIGKEGRAEFLEVTPNAKQFIHKGSQPKLSFDSFRFLPDDRILFREGMNRLLVADLRQGTVSTLPTAGGTTSKPISVDGRLAYAVLGDDGLITFYTIEVE